MTDDFSLFLLLIAAAGALISAIATIALLLRKPPAPPATVAPEIALAPAFTRVADDLARVEQALRSDSTTATAALRTELTAALAQSREEIRIALAANRAELATGLDKHREATAGAAAETRRVLDARLDALARQNAEKLEQMRQTVDEKLQSTLETRLAENFKLVSENLGKVISATGEMKAVATDVSDLRRVLTNVKTRGTWGEYQLAALLENLLTPGQYAANVKPNPRSAAIVEFAIKLPGTGDDAQPLWLPIDSKFPKEDYEALVIASEHADAAGVETAAKNLATRVESCARDIRDKYIIPPHTTDFAILFLPTEGLYSEVLRRPGLAEKLQREHRVLVAGPTTLAALLNSLQMGFRTLAIQKKSSEVWKLLDAIKKQFGSFGELLSKVQKKLDEAGNVIGDAAYRHEQITKKLDKVDTLTDADAALLPGTEP